MIIKGTFINENLIESVGPVESEFHVGYSICCYDTYQFKIIAQQESYTFKFDKENKANKEQKEAVRLCESAIKRL